MKSDLEIYLQRKKKILFGTRRKTLKTMTYLATGLFVALAAGVLFVGILFVWYAKDLPRPDKVKRVEGLSTVILDRSGVNLYDIFEDENRIPAKWEDIPKYLKDATIAIEDKDFYRHQGLSTTGIIRAAVNIFVFHNFQGGSTLTQQLVKNVLLTQERTLPRKMKEAILAIQIERKYSKDEILTMYLNEAPYGGTAVGVESASQYYFSKDVKDLGLVESAILAGLPQSPSLYSPFLGDGKGYVWRTENVLRRMREDGYINSNQEKEAKKQLENIKFASSDKNLKAPHFVAYIKDQLIEKYGQKAVDAGGFKVTTTLDWDLQKQAQKVVAEEVDKAKKLLVSNGAVVIIDPRNGEILSMVGSKDYMATDAAGLKFNVATQGLRQPGSAIKPVTYATAFKQGFTPSTMLMDLPTKYPSGEEGKPEYNPKNYDGKYRGPMQLRYALANSINTIAVKLTALVGVKEILETAYDMGLTTLEPNSDNLKRLGLSITLGGGEVKLLDLTSAFGVFATGGLRNDPVSILKIEDASGKIIYDHKQTTPKRVLPEDVSFLISDILSDNDARTTVFGPNSYLKIPGRSVAVKTGTTDDKRDNWTVGYSRQFVIGVWVGNNDNSPMHPSLASGVTGAAPIWNRLMKYVLADVADEPFIKPDSIIQMDVDTLGGGLPVEGGSTRKEYFIKGTEPTAPGTIYQMVKVAKGDNNKLASEVDINKGYYDLKPYVIIHEEDPVSTDGKNRWQEPIDKWISEQTDAKYHPPTDTYTGGDQISLSLKSPQDNSRINSNSMEVKAKAETYNHVDRIDIYMDGTKIKEIFSDEINESFDVEDGSHIVKIIAMDDKGNASERTVHIGVNEDYATPTPQPSPTQTPVPTPTP